MNLGRRNKCSIIKQAVDYTAQNMRILVFLYGRNILQMFSTSDSEEFQASRIVNRISNLLFTTTFCVGVFWVHFLQRNLLLDLVD